MSTARRTAPAPEVFGWAWWCGTCRLLTLEDKPAPAGRPRGVCPDARRVRVGELTSLSSQRAAAGVYPTAEQLHAAHDLVDAVLRYDEDAEPQDPKGDHEVILEAGVFSRWRALARKAVRR